jgi:hypothetical protein
LIERLLRAPRALAGWCRRSEQLELPLQQRVTAGRGRWWILIAGLLALVLWQSVFYRHAFPSYTLRSTHVLKASGGVLQWQQDFVYFLYYLGLFPVATTTEDREFSREGAERLLATQGQTLVMERFWTIRYGDLLKTYLYLPYAHLKGTPGERPLLVPANAAAWTLALAALFVAFWKVGHAPLGAILVVLLGSNPFQVTEVYARNNVFGWVITTGVLVLALHVPLLRGRRSSPAYTWLLPVVTGLLLASIRQIRTEPTVVAASALAAYVTARQLAPRVRAALVLLLATTFWAGSAAWTRYFDQKFAEAYRVVKAAGGHPYDGPRQVYHFFWHALWCGLGDFDTRYGYEWNDLAAMAYALPILEARGFRAEGYPALEPQPYDSLTLGVYWDRGRKYARTIFELPQYADVIRDKLLHDVSHDPAWYLGILGKRAWRLFTTTTPPSLSLGDGRRASLPERPIWGALALGVALLLLQARRGFLLKVLLFTLPVSTTPLLVYSGQGAVYYNVAHLVAFAFCAAWALEALLCWLSRRVVLGLVWRGRLYLLPREPEALARPRAQRVGT